VVTLACAFVTAAILSVIVLNNYVSSTSYDTSFNVDSSSGTGLITFPDLLFCTSSPWDLAQIKKFNISADLLSYLTYFLFSFGGFGIDSNTEATPEILALDQEYKVLMRQQFDNNALLLLGNVTKPCNQILLSCIFGAVLVLENCCKFFGAPEYVLGSMCYRTNSRMIFEVQEAGKYNSITLRMMNDKSMLAPLNGSLMNTPAMLFSGQVSAAVSDNRAHTYAVSSRQGI